MNKKDKKILDRFIKESDNLQGAKYVLKQLKKELFALVSGDEHETNKYYNGGK